MKNIKNKILQKGFTLIDVMVATAMMGILATVAVPIFKTYVNRAKQTEARVNLAGISLTEQAFLAENSAYTTRLDALGFNPMGNMNYSIGFTNDVPPPPFTWPPGLSTCLATGPALPGCSTALTWKLNVSATSVPNLPTTTPSTTSTWIAYALGKINGQDIDSWSCNDANVFWNLPAL